MAKQNTELEVLKIPGRIAVSGTGGAVMYISPESVLSPLGWKAPMEVEFYKTPDGHLLIKERKTAKKEAK